MAINTRPLKFIDYLPEVFHPADGKSNFLTQLLNAFELLFEGLESEIEGVPDLSNGGIPDLFSPNTTPPPQLSHRQQPGVGDFEFLQYLASWIALPLRPDKPLDWNRQFFETAIGLYAERSTRPGIEAMLRAWLKGDLLETTPAIPILSDLTPASNEATAVFQLGVTATLGVDTVLGVGPPFLFVVDLVVDPHQTALRTPTGFDTIQRAARSMLDAEKAGPHLLSARDQSEHDATSAARADVNRRQPGRSDRRDHAAVAGSLGFCQYVNRLRRYQHRVLADRLVPKTADLKGRMRWST